MRMPCGLQVGQTDPSTFHNGIKFNYLRRLPNNAGAAAAHDLLDFLAVAIEVSPGVVMARAPWAAP